MYRPPAFTLDDRQVLVPLLRRAAFGHLVTASADHGLESTSVPFVIDDAATLLRAHLSRANDHWRRLDGVDALMIVPGVDAYVSPRWYPSKASDPRVVPTWNYELVHLRGTVRIVDAVATHDIVRTLTDLHEVATGGSGERPWAVTDAPDEFIERQLRAIVGIELTVEAIEAKRKLSQNRADGDRRGVTDALVASDDLRAVAAGRAMTTLDEPSAERP